MAWTKRQFIAAAYAKIGLGSHAYDAEPEDLQGALMELDMMMSAWSEKNITISWPLSANPEDADLDQDTGAPDRANHAIVYNLAQRIALDKGRAVPPRVDALALSGYNSLLAHYNPIPTMQKKRRTAGAGNRQRGYGRQSLNQATEQTIGAPGPTVEIRNDR